jgi:hypothetical protein
VAADQQKISQIFLVMGQGGEVLSLQISSEALGTNLANLVLKVVLRIDGYVIVQNINWIFRLLIGLHAKRQCIKHTTIYHRAI